MSSPALGSCVLRLGWFPAPISLLAVLLLLPTLVPTVTFVNESWKERASCKTFCVVCFSLSQAKYAPVTFTVQNTQMLYLVLCLALTLLNSRFCTAPTKMANVCCLTFFLCPKLCVGHLCSRSMVVALACFLFLFKKNNWYFYSVWMGLLLVICSVETVAVSSSS